MGFRFKGYHTVSKTSDACNYLSVRKVTMAFALYIKILVVFFFLAENDVTVMWLMLMADRIHSILRVCLALTAMFQAVHQHTDIEHKNRTNDDS